MKFSCISPIAHLKDFSDSSLELSLAPLYNIPEYQQHYTSLAKKGTFVILDNGAFEDQSLPLDSLIQLALECGVSEVVLPDIIEDFRGTSDLLNRAFKEIRLRWMDEVKRKNLRFMIVPQGKNLYDWGECLRESLMWYTEFLGFKPLTVGIPKLCGEWVGGRRQLIQRFLLPLLSSSKFPEISIHLLGLERELISLSALSMTFPMIRSCDSVKPIVFASVGVRLSSEYGRTPQYPGRPSDYFQCNLTPEGLKLAQHNVTVLKYRAGEI